MQELSLPLITHFSLRSFCLILIYYFVFIPFSLGIFFLPLTFVYPQEFRVHRINNMQLNMYIFSHTDRCLLTSSLGHLYLLTLLYLNFFLMSFKIYFLFPLLILMGFFLLSCFILDMFIDWINVYNCQLFLPISFFLVLVLNVCTLFLFF